MMRSRVKIAFLAGLTTALVLSGCKHTKNEPENLLTADGSFMSADGEVDPMAAHLAARQQVDPRDINGPHRYTTTPTEDEVNKDTNVRVVRLENQMNDLQKDFKKLMPNISDSSAEAIKAAPVPPMKPELKFQAVTIAVATPVVKPAPERIMPAAGNATSTVTGVRIGQHPDRTRIVLDVTAPGQFSSDIDNDERRLTVQLPQGAWTGALQETLANDPVIGGYSAKQAAGGGITLAIELKKPAKVTLSTSMPPNEVYGHRIVFDVAPL